MNGAAAGVTAGVDKGVTEEITAGVDASVTAVRMTFGMKDKMPGCASVMEVIKITITDRDS